MQACEMSLSLLSEMGCIGFRQLENQTSIRSLCDVVRGCSCWSGAAVCRADRLAGRFRGLPFIVAGAALTIRLMTDPDSERRWTKCELGLARSR